MGWYARLGQWSEQHSFAVDLTVTLLVATVFVPSSAAFSAVGASGYGTSFGWGMLWSALVLAPLPWRRTHPVTSAVAVYAIALLHLLAGYLVIFPADFAVLVALYSVTVYGPRWAHRTAMVSSLVGAFLLGVALGLQSGRLTDLAAMVFFSTAFGSVTFLAVWAFGLARRSRGETIAALVDRAEQLEVEQRIRRPPLLDDERTERNGREREAREHRRRRPARRRRLDHRPHERDQPGARQRGTGPVDPGGDRVVVRAERR